MQNSKARSKNSTGHNFKASQGPNDSNYPHMTKEHIQKELSYSKEETTEEKFSKVVISDVEQRNVDRVWDLFENNRKYTKDNEIPYFDASDVRRILKKLGDKEISQHQIDIMIWEVDENLDKKVSRAEFDLMYKKCIEDKTGLEPKNLFNLVQYLMFCRPPEDEDGKVTNELDFNTTITAEDTYFLIYGRLDRQLPSGEKRARLDEEIKIIFGDSEKNPDGTEKKIDYLTYLERVNAHVLEMRKLMKKKEIEKAKNYFGDESKVEK